MKDWFTTVLCVGMGACILAIPALLISTSIKPVDASTEQSREAIIYRKAFPEDGVVCYSNWKHSHRSHISCVRID